MAEWLLSANLPYVTVENDRFKYWVNSLNPKFTIPSESNLRKTLMPEIYSR